jgi:agmatine deiminase
MPAEWAPHERTIMGWPCRRELWGDQLGHAKADYAATANAVAAFEPLTMVCATAQDAAEARAALTGDVEVVELAIDDSWLRDSGPIFVLDGEARRAGVHFGFNSWGEKFTPYAGDAAVGRLLIDRLGDRRYDAPFVLEGGSVAVDGEGTLLTTEQCLLHRNRNPTMTREAIEHGLCDFLGAERVVWLGQGLAEDKDTDGHVDLIAAFTRPGEVLMQSTPPGTPSSERMADNHSRLVAAGLEVVDFPILPTLEVGGEQVAVGHLNFYLCNGAAIVPVAGVPSDAEALERIGAAYPDREVVGVPGGVIAFGGGGPHCITQQVPAAGVSAPRAPAAFA